jgi:hypothetical protein
MYRATTKTNGLSTNESRNRRPAAQGRALAIAFAVIAAALSSCEVAPDGTLVAAELGGTVISGDGLVRLVIPPGALTADTLISIDPISAEQLPAALDGIPITGVAYDLQPDGLEFLKPAAVNIELDGVDPDGVIPAMIFSTYDSDKGIEPLTLADGSPALTVLDEDHVRMEGVLRHFSKLYGCSQGLEWIITKIDEQPTGSTFTADIAARNRHTTGSGIAIEITQEGSDGWGHVRGAGEDEYPGVVLKAEAGNWYETTFTFECSDKPGDGNYWGFLYYTVHTENKTPVGPFGEYWQIEDHWYKKYPDGSPSAVAAAGKSMKCVAPAENPSNSGTDGDDEADAGAETDTDDEADDAGTETDTDNEEDAGTETETDTDTDEDPEVEPCDGACSVEFMGVYTECTCGVDDPCGWAGDDVCDDTCLGIVDEMFDDGGDCEESTEVPPLETTVILSDTTPPEEGCEPLSVHTFNDCRNGTWHVVSRATYVCESGLVVKEILVVQTNQPCEADAVAPPVQAFIPVGMPDDCVSPVTLLSIFLLACPENTFWNWLAYDLIQCLDGRLYLERTPASDISTAIPCTDPPPESPYDS